MLHVPTQKCNIETCLDRHPIFHSVLVGPRKPHPNPWSQPQRPQLDIQHGSTWINVVYGVYRTHNLEAQAVTRSHKYTQVWHVHVVIQELLAELVNFLTDRDLVKILDSIFCRSMSEHLHSVIQLCCAGSTVGGS